MSERPPDPRALAELRVGETLNNKWHIDRLIDMGGMAAVYAATHRNGKKVAVKMLHPSFSTNADVRERFLREGYVANQVDHPGSVSVLDDDVLADGSVFLVMELLEGESLDRWLTRAGGKLYVLDVLAVADQVLDVLARFHARHVIHRDIKPGNLFATTAGVIKVLDFGLARLRDPSVQGATTASGIVLGTAAYMPPEQAQGKVDQIDGRTDLFAMGAVMFQALTGRFVHKGRNATDRLFSAMKDPVDSLGDVDPTIPKWVAGIVDKALAFDKFDRWDDATSMRTAVRGAYEQIAKQAAAAAKTAPAAPASDAGEMVEPSIFIEVSFGDVVPPKGD